MSEILTAGHALPNGAVVKVIMARALGDRQDECVGCQLMTPRYLLAMRETDEGWRTCTPVCDYCFELMRKLGIDSVQGVQIGENTKLVKLPWSVDVNDQAPLSSGESCIVRAAPDGTSFKVIMGRTDGEKAECLGCAFPTTRQLVAQREGAGSWKRTACCDTCWGLVKKLGGATGTDWYGQ